MTPLWAPAPTLREGAVEIAIRPEDGMLAPIDIDLGFLPQKDQGIYLVGGAVRDLLLGLEPADMDLVVEGEILPVAARIARKTGGTMVDLGKKGFGVVRVAAPDRIVDLAPLRQPSIQDDLMQRDFTVNAMAVETASRQLVDCTGGFQDLRRGIVRMVSPAAFRHDPVRMVRAYRLAAVLGFVIAPETASAIAGDRHRVVQVAGERVWAEMVKIFTAVDAAPVVRQMAGSGLLTAILPELAPTVGCTQNQHHQFDVFEHTLRVYENLEKLLAGFADGFPELAEIALQDDLAGQQAMVKYAALLHDAGKPHTAQINPRGEVRFPGHAARSAALAQAIARRLKLSNTQRTISDTVIRQHVRPLTLFLADQKGQLGLRGMVRFFTHCGRQTLPTLLHAMADIMAKQAVLSPAGGAFVAFCRRLAETYATTCRRRTTEPPLIGGDDLKSLFGLPPSPRFKAILREVDERRLTGELTSRQAALAWVAAHLRNRPAGLPPASGKRP